jgi:hypothetical protein
METVHHDSELMTQYVAAIAVPNSQRFVAVRDEKGYLVLFSLGTDLKIYVSKLDVSGHRVVRDFGLMLGLPSTYEAQAFDVAQDTSSTLYIAVATARGSNKDQSDLHLLRPFKPSEADLASQSTNLKEFIMSETGGGSKPSRVFSIFMVRSLWAQTLSLNLRRVRLIFHVQAPSSVGQSYPPVLFAFRTEIHKSQDLAAASVKQVNKAWSWTRKGNVKLPENASEIKSIQPLVMQYGSHTVPGYATLYKIQGKLPIRWRRVHSESQAN